MKNKSFLFIVALGALPVLGIAKPVGIAQSRGDFSIARGEQVLNLATDQQSIVQQKDMIRAAEEPVLLNTTSRSNLFLNSNTEVEVQSQDTINLIEGQIALGFEQDVPVKITFQNLEIVPQKNLDTSTIIKPIANDSGSSILVDGISANEIRIMGIGESFIINDFTKGNQVAVIPSGDIMRLVRNAQGIWEPASIPNFSAAEEGVKTNNLKRFVESRDDRRVVFFWQGAAAGAAIAGAAGAIWYEREDDEDDQRRDRRNRENDREETSPFFP